MEINSSWNKELAQIWTKMVGPSRPTISELAIYLKYIRIKQQESNRRLKMLVLGSTPEFRDLGYEENMEVTVIDSSQEYHNEINREIRHKCAIEQENVVFIKWQDINYQEEFDIIIGDLVIGNIPPAELECFILKVNNALCKGGLFLGKSFYVDKKFTPITPQKMVENYYHGFPYHPYSYFAYNLTICVLKDNMLTFRDMYLILEELNNKGILLDETFEKFKNIGWDKEMKFKFHVPYKDDFENLILKYLKIENVEFANEVYSPFFPLYIIKK